jgi:hypothetical protein
MSGYPVFYARSKSIQEHVGYIIKTKNRSIRDPEVRQLAVKIVSSSYVWRTDPRTGQQEPFIKAWNKYFHGEKSPICPPRDDECEIVKIWNFVVRNFRYVYDPLTVDTFATAKLSLEAGGGDCDDAAVLFASLLEAIGFHMRCRVITTPDEPDNWVHIYPLVGVPKDDASDWLPLDMTVSGYKPGQEWPKIAKLIDFEM